MNRFVFRGVILLFTAASFILQSCQSSKTATSSRMLKFNFQQGKSYDYDMISDFDQDVMGQKQQISMTAQYGMDVTGANNGVVDITTTFNAMKMNMQVMGMTIEADTEKPLPKDTSSGFNPLTMMNKMFHAIKGQQFKMKVDTEGKVLEVTGMKEIATKMIESMDMGPEFQETMRKSFDQQFNESSMKEQFERAFFIFPGKEVKVGDSWVKEHNSPGGGMGKFKTTYTVDEIEGDNVTLDVKSVFAGDGTASKMTGTQNGEMVVDSRSGLIMESNLDMDVEAEEGGQKMKMKGKIKIRGRERK